MSDNEQEAQASHRILGVRSGREAVLAVQNNLRKKNNGSARIIEEPSFPDKLKEKFARKVAKMIKGKEVRQNIDGFTFVYTLRWDFDMFPSVISWAIYLPDTASNMERYLFSHYMEYSHGIEIYEDKEWRIRESEEFLNFQDQINDIVEESDFYEDSYSGYSWESIIERAEEIHI